MSQLPVLLYADSERSADMLYFGGFHAPDPFVACELGGRRVAVLNALEYSRGLKESRFEEILSLETLVAKARKAWPKESTGIAGVIAVLAKEYGVEAFQVPDDFPVGLAHRLGALGVQLAIQEGDLFPGRQIKDASQAACIREGNRCSAAGIGRAAQILREAEIRGLDLYWRNEALTSERLKFEIEVACLELGGLSLNTIAAGGDQACDPHCSGSGVLRANELIIVDVFPRMQRTGYHGDMTRTFLKGKANDAQRALVEAVACAQKRALQAIRAGVNGRSVHAEVVAEFDARGYETKRSEQGAVGFFHGTGHGLGLAVHEMPRLSGTLDCDLPEGSVVTVEPGLYYPGLGACRIEDVVQVTAAGYAYLSSSPYDWEIA